MNTVCFLVTTYLQSAYVLLTQYDTCMYAGHITFSITPCESDPHALCHSSVLGVACETTAIFRYLDHEDLQV